jgi:thiol:disulfide interchange protein
MGRFLMKVSVYSASWCASCGTLKQALNSINTEDLEIEILDVDALGMQALSKVGIKGIPSIILYDNQGNEIKRKSGALTKKQLEDFLGLESN